MKNSTLLFRSLAIIALIAGGAHWMTYAAKQTEKDSVITEEVSIEPSGTTSGNSSEAEKPETGIKASNDSQYNEETDYIIGLWKVVYDSEDFKGAVVYSIKKEGAVFNAYTYGYEDENGHGQEAEGTKTLTITSFDGYTGKGVYAIEYEKQTYEVECTIDMVDENTFILSYDYHGYGDMETWKRQ